jgi:hypothetical protein
MLEGAAAAAAAADDGALSDSEKALAKGMVNKAWRGPPLLESVTGKPLGFSVLPGLKKRKGKKRDVAVAPALDRILGYAGSDVSDDEGGAAGGGSAEEESAGGEEEQEEDRVVDREHIKLRALKLTARHAAAGARAAQAAAAASKP